MTIEFNPAVFRFSVGCPEGQTDAVFFVATPGKIIEYNNLNIPSTQIWQATWASGETFNVTLEAYAVDPGPGIGQNIIEIDFLDQCIATDLLTLPVILTTTVF